MSEAKEINNITLVGLPAAGKSTIGVLLAKKIGYDFVDVDLVIQNRTGMRLEEIIAERGISGFLQLEEEINASLDCRHSVIAPGGSVIYGRRAMQHLSELGAVVYLKVSYEDWSGRLGDLKERGVVVKEGMTLRDLYEERCARYEDFVSTHDCIIAEQHGNDFEEIIRETITCIIDNTGLTR